jgi:hypothetical protein
LVFFLCAALVQHNVVELGHKMCNEHNKALDHVENILTDIKIVCTEPKKQLDDGYLVLDLL